MTHSRRQFVKTTGKLTALGLLGLGRASVAHAREPASGAGRFAQIDALLRAAAGTGELPGIVAMAASANDIVYEGSFGRRRIDAAPAMTRDTVFRVASMV